MQPLNLQPGEELVWRGAPHPSKYALGKVLFVILGIVLFAIVVAVAMSVAMPWPAPEVIAAVLAGILILFFVATPYRERLNEGDELHCYKSTDSH